MFGGSDEANELNDFWALDLKTNEWKLIENSHSPSPRAGAKMVFDPAGNQIFLIGRKPQRGSESLKVSRDFNCERIS